MDKLTQFIRRLEKIGVKVTLAGSAPWIYLRKINEIPVLETHNANHGFSVAWYTKTGVAFEDDMKPVFRLIRKYNNLITS